MDYNPVLEKSPEYESERDDYERPDWDDYFLEIMRVVAKRGNCNRGRSGAIIVKDKRIIATGYVGAPAGLPTCDEIGHLYKKVLKDDGTVKVHCVRTTHAEMNAILQAARFGISCDGATIYCKMEPCLDCTKAIINAGIKRVVCEYRYHAADLSREFLRAAGVKLEVKNDEVLKYKNQEADQNHCG